MQSTHLSDVAKMIEFIEEFVKSISPFHIYQLVIEAQIQPLKVLATIVQILE